MSFSSLAEKDTAWGYDEIERTTIEFKGWKNSYSSSSLFKFPELQMHFFLGFSDNTTDVEISSLELLSFGYSMNVTI